MTHSSFRFTASLLFLTMGLGLAVGRGQGPALDQVDQSKRAREANQMAMEAVDSDGKVPEFYDGESSDLGPQNILQMERKRHFKVVADTQLFHTNNFFLTDGGKVDATVLVGTLQLALAPKAYNVRTGKLEPRLGVQQQWYNFGIMGREGGAGFSYDMFDFDAQTAFVDGRYHFGEGWIAQLGFEASRLIDRDTERERYKELAPSWGLQKRFELCSSSHLLLGYEGILHDSTDASAVPPAFRLNDRVDHSVFGALSAAWGEHLVGQAYYRFRYTDFQSSARSDYLHSLGLSLHYFFNSRLSLRTYLAYDRRNSHDSPVPDYEKFDAGGGVNFTLSF